MNERFTDRTKKVMVLANQQAQKFNQEHIEKELDRKRKRKRSIRSLQSLV